MKVAVWKAAGLYIQDIYWLILACVLEGQGFTKAFSGNSRCYFSCPPFSLASQMFAELVLTLSIYLLAQLALPRCSPEHSDCPINHKRRCLSSNHKRREQKQEKTAEKKHKINQKTTNWQDVYIINNPFKCEWSTCFNQKTQGTEWIKKNKKNHICAAYKRLLLDFKHIQTEHERKKKTFHKLWARLTKKKRGL